MLNKSFMFMSTEDRIFATLCYLNVVIFHYPLSDLCQVFNVTHDTLEHTRAYMEATQDTHTPAGKPEIAVNLVSAFSHPGLSFLKDPPGAVGCPSLIRDGHVFCYFACFFCWGP